jgi:hypothetical protein
MSSTSASINPLGPALISTASWSNPTVRLAVLQALAFTGGFSWAPTQPSEADPYDRLATVLGDVLQLEQTCVAPFLARRQAAPSGT